MAYQYTIILHGVMGTLCLASLMYLSYRKKHHQPPVFHSYFNWFLFFFLYNVTLSSYLVTVGTLNMNAAVAYSVALFFLGIAMWEAFRVGITFLIVSERLRKVLVSLYLVGVMAAVALHFVFPEVPRGSIDGSWVFWYSNRTIALFYTFFAFVAGWLYGYRNLIAISSLSSGLLRFKAAVFSMAGFLLPFSAYYYFGVKEVWEVVLSMTIGVIGLALFTVGNFIGVLRRIS